MFFEENKTDIKVTKEEATMNMGVSAGQDLPRLSYSIHTRAAKRQETAAKTMRAKNPRGLTLFIADSKIIQLKSIKKIKLY
jgi:hypothetical protein